MFNVIRIEMYGEYVLSRMQIAEETLLDFVYGEEDDDVSLPALTPELPHLAIFTQDEIEAFEFIYKKDMFAVHGKGKTSSY